MISRWTRLGNFAFFAWLGLMSQLQASDEAPERSSSSSYSPATPEVTPTKAAPPEFESGEGKSSNQIIASLSVLAAIGLFAATKLGNGGVDLKSLASSSLPYDLVRIISMRKSGVGCCSRKALLPFLFNPLKFLWDVYEKWDELYRRCHMHNKAYSFLGQL